MKKIPITVYVSKTVPEKVWRDALAKLGEMQATAIAKGIGRDWKCEFQHKDGIFFVAQKDTEFMIHRDGDEPHHVKHCLRIKATAYAEDKSQESHLVPAKKPEAVLKDYRNEVIREMKRLAVNNPSQREKLDEVCEKLATYYENPIRMGFLGEVSTHDTACHIIESLREPK